MFRAFYESPDFLPLNDFIIPRFMFAFMENVGSVLFYGYISFSPVFKIIACVICEDSF